MYSNNVTFYSTVLVNKSMKILINKIWSTMKRHDVLTVYVTLFPSLLQRCFLSLRNVDRIFSIF